MKNIKKEKRTLPSGATFIRNRCIECGGYWDTDHKTKDGKRKNRKDELPYHFALSD